MYTAIKGTYENGQITLQELPPTTQKTPVVIMFLSDTNPPAAKNTTWPREVLEFTGVSDFEPFENYRADLLPITEDPLA